MKSFAKKIAKISSVVALSAAVFVGFNVYANRQTNLQINVTDNETVSTLFVDYGNGKTASGFYAELDNPIIQMSDVDFSFATEESTGTLGTTDAGSGAIAILDPNNTASLWSLSLSGSGSWVGLSDSSKTFDFNNSDFNLGQLYVDAADSVWIRADDAALGEDAESASGNLSPGGDDLAFVSGVTDSITLVTSAATGQQDYASYIGTDIGLRQYVPAETPVQEYQITMTITII